MLNYVPSRAKCEMSSFVKVDMKTTFHYCVLTVAAPPEKHCKEDVCVCIIFAKNNIAEQYIKEGF